jgi:hypothetical protein
MNLHTRGAAYLLVLLLASCSSNSSDSTDHHEPAGEQNIDDVIYVGEVTDEALVRLLDGTPKNDPRQAVIIDSPDLSVPLSKDSPATLQFHLASQASRAPLLQGPSAPPRPGWQRSLHEFLRLLAPEGVAHAHGAAYNGPAYYLVITGADSKQVLKVFTPKTSFTPEALDWQHLAEAPQPLRLEITSAFFDANSIGQDGGPFVGGTFSIRIE